MEDQLQDNGTDNIPAVDESTVVVPEPLKSPEGEKPANKRFQKTVNFLPEEVPALEAAFKARVDAGLTTDWNHFIRQCMDSALNFKMRVVIPENTTIPFTKTFN